MAGVRSALLETAEVGFLGKGSLVGVLFEIHSLEYTQDVNISMIKKACSDAVSMLFKKASIVLYEPYMALHLECPVEFAGVVTNDIQSIAPWRSTPMHGVLAVERIFGARYPLFLKCNRKVELQVLFTVPYKRVL